MDRPYLFYELTNSICSTCLRKVEAKVIIQDQKVYLQKYCPTHKFEKVLISTDVSYFKQQRDFLKPGQMPRKFNTPVRYGCPYDCGLCPDHEQHSCLTLVEVTDRCNLQCPICYAESGPSAGSHRTLEQIEFMLDCVVRNEGEPDVVQISGGEPTVHPDFFAILDAAKKRPIKHLMLNTNGVRIAKDPAFAARLKSYMPGFELYLQFDSLEQRPLEVLRGEDLRTVRTQALEHLNEHNISTTLVVTVKKGLNDHELGDILRFAMEQPCVRGVTFQPIQAAGRLENFNPETDRLTLSEVRQNILTQFPLFAPEDVIPVPCHPDCLAMAYALKVKGERTEVKVEGIATDTLLPKSFNLLPLTRLMDPKLLLSGEGNTIIYEKNAAMREQVFKAFATSHSPASAVLSLKHLLCCLPTVQVPDNLGYDNLFRVIIMQFLDPHNFDVRSVKKTCVHIVHPDGRIIPFDTYNLFYRNESDGLLDQLKSLHAPQPLSTVPLTIHAKT